MKRFAVTGMSCAACGAGVEKAAGKPVGRGLLRGQSFDRFPERRGALRPSIAGFYYDGIIFAAVCLGISVYRYKA